MFNPVESARPELLTHPAVSAAIIAMAIECVSATRDDYDAACVDDDDTGGYRAANALRHWDIAQRDVRDWTMHASLRGWTVATETSEDGERVTVEVECDGQTYTSTAQLA